MPRIAVLSHALSAQHRAGFLELRDRFRTAGFELFYDHSAGVYQVRRRDSVVATVATLTSARRWLQRMQVMPRPGVKASLPPRREA